MKVEFYKAALIEIDEAFIYYESQLAGLGIDFIDNIQDTISRIKNFPEAYSPFNKSTRRCLINKFP